MKLKTSTKISDEVRLFLKKLSVNCIKTEKVDDILSYDDALFAIVKYFKLNNDKYLELIELIGEMEEQKNGTK